jgi:hypothetical protein
MSGSLRVGSPPLPLPTSPPSPGGPSTPGVSPAGGAAFRSMLSGSPAPVVAPVPSAFSDPAGLAQRASRVSAAGQVLAASAPLGTGSALAAADLSMAGWSMSARPAVSSAAATPAQVGAILPVTFASADRKNPPRASFV